MPRFEAEEQVKGNPAVPYWKQKNLVKPGMYMVLKIFKPNMYPSGTLVCSDFRITYPLAEWEKMKPAMAEAYANGEAMHFEVKNNKVSLVTPSEEFVCEWERQEWGARTKFEEEPILYKPFNSVVQSDNKDDDSPF